MPQTFETGRPGYKDTLSVSKLPPSVFRVPASGFPKANKDLVDTKPTIVRIWSRDSPGCPNDSWIDLRVSGCPALPCIVCGAFVAYDMLKISLPQSCESYGGAWRLGESSDCEIVLPPHFPRTEPSVDESFSFVSGERNNSLSEFEQGPPLECQKQRHFFRQSVYPKPDPLTEANLDKFAKTTAQLSLDQFKSGGVPYHGSPPKQAVYVESEGEADHGGDPAPTNLEIRRNYFPTLRHNKVVFERFSPIPFNPLKELTNATPSIASEEHDGDIYEIDSAESTSCHFETQARAQRF